VVLKRLLWAAPSIEDGRIALRTVTDRPLVASLHVRDEEGGNLVVKGNRLVERGGRRRKFDLVPGKDFRDKLGCARRLEGQGHGMESFLSRRARKGMQVLLAKSHDAGVFGLVNGWFLSELLRGRRLGPGNIPGKLVVVVLEIVLDAGNRRGYSRSHRRWQTRRS
jgi:hypothetical protein